MRTLIEEVAFEDAIDPMWVIDIEGFNAYRFIAINRTFTTITGWQKDQVVGQSMEKVIPPTSHNLVREKYNEAINTGKIVDYIEESIHPAGIKYGHIRVIPLKNAEGKIQQLLGIAHDITDKTLLEDKLVRERDRKSKEITAAAIKGQEAERSRVSRELHDNVNQVLTTVKLYTELCLDEMVDPKVILPKCTALLVTSIEEIRSLSRQLSAPSLGNMSYQESISELVNSMKVAMAIPIRLDMKLEDCIEMDPELHLTIYRVLQEQLNNIHKYAMASNVEVDLTMDSSHLILCITDDGVGFDTTKSRKGIGLMNIESRTQLLHGSFKLKSKVGEGTSLELQFPAKILDGICIPINL